MAENKSIKPLLALTCEVPKISCLCHYFASKAAPKFLILSCKGITNAADRLRFSLVPSGAPEPPDEIR